MPDEETSRIGGVVLAAGESSRFDPGNKLLEPVEGTPIVRRVAETARESSLDDVVAILGYEAAAVEEALEGLDISIRHNDDYAEGQSTSVRRGVEFAREAGWDAAVFLLGDMPFVRPETVDSIISAYRSGDGSIFAPRYEGKRGNPVLFDAQHFDTLANVSGDRGGRELVEEHDGRRFVDTDDPGIVQDVDAVTDLRKYTE